jgi:hypothetical protein
MAALLQSVKHRREKAAEAAVFGVSQPTSRGATILPPRNHFVDRPISAT